MTSLILRIEIGRADIDTPCECSQTRRWSAVGVQTFSVAENCKRAKSDSGAGAKIVHDGPESVFTLARNGRSRCAGIGVHVGPENAQHGRCAAKQTGLEARRHEVKPIVACRFSNAL